MRKIAKLTFLLLILSGEPIFAQSRGYIVIADSAMHQGMLKYDPSNPFELEFRSGKVEGNHFSSSEISEFGFTGGPEYVTRSIQDNDSLQPVFLEILEGDGIRLLILRFNKEQLFLEDDSLLSLNKNNYSDIIKEYSGSCNRHKDQYRLVKYRKSALRSFFYELNTGKCRNIPFTSIGILVGMENTRFSFPNNAIVFISDDRISLNSSSVYGGFFAEVPVYGKKVNFSLVGEISVGRQIYTKEFISETKNQDLKIDLKLINFSISPKFTLNTAKIRPYFSGGGDFSYAVESNSRKFQANLGDDSIIFSDYRDILRMPKFYYGFSIRTGVQFFYLYNHYITVEAGYSSLFSENSIHISRLGVKVKFNL